MALVEHLAIGFVGIKVLVLDTFGWLISFGIHYMLALWVVESANLKLLIEVDEFWGPKFDCNMLDY